MKFQNILIFILILVSLVTPIVAAQEDEGDIEVLSNQKIPQH